MVCREETKAWAPDETPTPRCRGERKAVKAGLSCWQIALPTSRRRHSPIAIGRIPLLGLDRAMRREDERRGVMTEGTRPAAMKEAITNKGFLLANLEEPKIRRSSKESPEGPGEERRGVLERERKKVE